MLISKLRHYLENFNSTLDDQADSPLKELMRLEAKLGNFDRELAPQELYVLFKTILIKTAPMNPILLTRAKASFTNLAEGDAQYALYHTIYEDLIEKPTTNYIPIFTLTFWHRLEELEVLGLASEDNFNKICVIDTHKVGKIFELMRLMQDFKLLTQANFDLMISNPAYVELVISSQEFRDCVFAGYELRWGEPPINTGEPTLAEVLETKFIHVYQKDLHINLYLPLDDGSGYKVVDISSGLTESLKFALATPRALEAHDISPEDYVILQQIVKYLKSRLANQLTEAIFKLFFIDVPSAIVQAVERHFIKAQLKFEHDCQTQLYQGEFGKRFGEDKKLQFAVIQALEAEFKKYQLGDENKEYKFIKNRRFPTYEFIGEAIRITNFSFLTHDRIAMRANVVRQQTSGFDTLLSIFGKAPKVPPITLPNNPAQVNGLVLMQRRN